jgi:chaperone required for assembly of F1-ATPase
MRFAELVVSFFCIFSQGFQYGVENLKSIILMLGITDKLLTVEKAVQLSRLETVYQVNIQLGEEWGGWGVWLELGLLSNPILYDCYVTK